MILGDEGHVERSSGAPADRRTTSSRMHILLVEGFQLVVLEPSAKLLAFPQDQGLARRGSERRTQGLRAAGSSTHVDGGSGIV